MKIYQIISSLFRSKKTTKDEILIIQKEGAEIAVEFARAYNFKLDYSDDSLKKVDKLLTIFGKEYLETKNKKNFESFALTFGLYIIEVMERNHGKGYLERKLLGLEKDDFPYYWNGNLIFPCIWCLDRIFKNDADNVWEMYKKVIS
uniref:hypothetical protein n=1 Tax=Flavobacterium sp. TaxID=239 RepID=UPI004049DD2B